MGQRTKPGINWADIQIRYRAGETSSQIAQTVPEVTRQAIDKRAKKEGWADDKPEGSRWLDVIKANHVKVGDKDTPETRAKILEAIDLGMPKRHAAEYAGISYDAMNEWEAKSATFASQVIEAQRTFEQRHVGNIAGAGDRGDWKASAHLLAKNPATRNTYADKTEKSGPVINVVLSIPRPTDAQTTDFEHGMIDITPEESIDDSVL